MALEQIKEETGYSISKIKKNVKAAGLSLATLDDEDGTKVVINEGNQLIRYKGEMYKPGEWFSPYTYTLF